MEKEPARAPREGEGVWADEGEGGELAGGGGKGERGLVEGRFTVDPSDGVGEGQTRDRVEDWTGWRSDGEALVWDARVAEKAARDGLVSVERDDGGRGNGPPEGRDGCARDW